LNHNLGDLILMGKVDEPHYKEIMRVITAFARSCQTLLKMSGKSSRMKQTQVIKKGGGNKAVRNYEPKQEKLLAEMDALNHDLGDLILLGKADESHYREIIKVITAYARSCRALVKGEWRFIENVPNSVTGIKIRRNTIMSESLKSSYRI